MERCDTPDFFSNEDCHKDVYKHVKIDERVINQCMKDSGGTEGDKSNAFLDAELEAQTKRGVVVLPTAFVNTAAIRGKLSTNNVFTAICAGYLSGTKPDVCDQCEDCPDKLTCATEGVCTATKHGGVSFKVFFLSMLSVAAMVGLGGFYYYRKSQDEMRAQVRGILAEYMPLEDQEGGGLDVNPAVDFAKQAGENLIS